MSRPPTRWSPTAVAAFEAGFRLWARRHLRGIHVAGLPAGLPEEQPLLLVANHASWWDGFVVREVQRRLRPRAPLHTVMSSAELARFPALRWLGALDVGPGSPRALLRAMRFLAQERRRRPGLAVAVFPQGRLWPAHRRPLEFRRGVAAIARRLAPAIALPVGIQYETFASPVPSAFVSVGPAMRVERELDLPALEGAVAAELDRMAAFLDAEGERAAAAWPGAAHRVPDAHAPHAGGARQAPERSRSSAMRVLTSSDGVSATETFFTSGPSRS